MNAIAHHAVVHADDRPTDTGAEDSPPWADSSDTDHTLLLRLAAAVALTITALAIASTLLV